ncbi:MAG: crotonobetainyl-CoA:carnitine CoA-transferase CaiB-like acyl-CoA transferase [Flavobacterium sp.]
MHDRKSGPSTKEEEIRLPEEYLFADLKVLDVGSWIAAPVAATMLADFGAQVTKIEIPGSGDPYRLYAASPGAPDSEVNYAWQMDARNKRSLSLNLKSAEGRAILLKLVADCDVYITNHSPKMREDWGLGYEALHQLNPRLIYASLTAYGEQGPERNREGFDLVAYWSRSGLMDLVRGPGSAPAAALPGMGDHPTAVSMYAGIVTALLRRGKTGEGSYVHTSLLANGIWSASCVAQGSFTGATFGRYRHDMGQMYSRCPYEAQDGRWLQFTMVRTQEEMDLMFAVLGMPEVLLDERFAEPEARLKNGAVLVELIRPVLLSRDSKEWMIDFQALGVPVALVGEVERLTDDVQVTSNKILLDGADTGMPKVIKHPVNIDGLPCPEVQRAPDVGEHGYQVLTELGYSKQEIEAFIAKKVI